MKETKVDIKEAARVYGIFLGIITFCILVLVGMIVASRGSWENGLRSEVAQVLEDKNPGKWTVGEMVKQNIPFAYSSAIYKVQSKTSNEDYYAVIVRTNTLNGPVPAVFTFSKSNGTEFIGYSGIHGRILRILEENSQTPLSSSSLRLDYWNNKVREILSKAGISNE